MMMQYVFINERITRPMSSAAPQPEDNQCKKCGNVFDDSERRRSRFIICPHFACRKCFTEMCDNSGCTFCSDLEPEDHVNVPNGESVEVKDNSEQLSSGNGDSDEVEPQSYILESVLSIYHDHSEDEVVDFPEIEKLSARLRSRNQPGGNIHEQVEVEDGQVEMVDEQVEDVQMMQQDIDLIYISSDDELSCIDLISDDEDEDGNSGGPPSNLSVENEELSGDTAPQLPAILNNLVDAQVPQWPAANNGNGWLAFGDMIPPPAFPDDDKSSEPEASPPDAIAVGSGTPTASWRKWRESPSGSSVTTSSSGVQSDSSSSDSSSSSSSSSSASDRPTQSRKRRMNSYLPKSQGPKRYRKFPAKPSLVACTQTTKHNFKRHDKFQGELEPNQMPNLSCIIDEDFSKLRIKETNADQTANPVEKPAPQLTPISLNPAKKVCAPNSSSNTKVSERSKCHLCPKTFVLNRRLANHLIAIHSDKLPFVCDLCGWSFSSKERRETHRRFHVKPRAFKCLQCPATFNSKKGWRRHYRVMHSKKPVTLMAAANKPNREKMTTCQYCKQEFQNRTQLAYHVRKNHSNKRPHVCPNCPMTYERETYLKRHMLTHNQDDMYYCAICDTKFEGNSRLERHFEIEHGFRVRFNQVEKVHFKEFCPECQTLFDEGNCVKAAYMKCGHVSCLKCVIRAELGCGQCTTETAVAEDENGKKRQVSKSVASVPPKFAREEGEKQKKKRRTINVIAEEDQPQMLTQQQNTSRFRRARRSLKTRKLKKRTLAPTTRGTRRTRSNWIVNQNTI